MERRRKYGHHAGSGSPSSSQPEPSQSSQPQRRVASASSSSSKTTTTKQHIRNDDQSYLDDDDEDEDSSEHHDEGEEYEDSFDKPALKKRSKKASAPSSYRSNSSNSARQRRAASVSSNPPSPPPKQKPKGIKLPDRVADSSAQHATKRAKTTESSAKSLPPTFSSDEEATPRQVGRPKPSSRDDDDEEDEPPARKKRPPAGPSRSASRPGNSAPSTASILKIADAAQAIKSSLRSIPDADAQAKRTASRDPFDDPEGRRGLVRNISKDSPFASGNEDAAQKLAEAPERKIKLAMQIPSKDIIGGGGGGDSPRCSGDSLFPASSIASDASTSATSPLPPGPSDAEMKRMLMKASKVKTMLKLPPKEAATTTGLAGRTAASFGDVPSKVADLKVCPFCEQPMPRKPSPELVEMMQPYLDKWHQGRTLKATETLAACTKHQEEFEVIPNGKKQGWITTLDVSELGQRIENEDEGHRSRVEEVLQRPQKSEFWDVALRIREERRGRGKGRRGEIDDAQAGEPSTSATSAGWMAQMNEVQAGYYGEQGFDCIRGTLAKWLLLGGAVPTVNIDEEADDESSAPPPLSLKTSSALALIYPLTAVEFVDYVLVPEVACSLIAYDYAHPKTHRYGAGKREKPRDLSMQEAREIKRQSTAYGNAMFPADAGGRGESLFDVGSVQKDAAAAAGPSKATNGNGKRVASQPTTTATTSTTRRRRGQTSDSDSILDTPSSSKSTTSSSKRTPVADAAGASASRPRPRPQAAGAAAGPSASPSANGHRSYTARFFDDDDDEELGKSQTPKAGGRTGAGANASAPIDLTTPSPASGKRPRPKPRTSGGAPQRPVIRGSDADEDVGNATFVVRENEEDDDDDDDFFSRRGKMARPRPRVSDAAAGGFSSDGASARDSTVVQGKEAITTATTTATSSPRTPSSLRRASAQGQQHKASAQQQQSDAAASDTNEDVDSLAASQGSVVVLISNKGLTAANPAGRDNESQTDESQRGAEAPRPPTPRHDSSSLTSLSSSSSQMSSFDWPTTPPPPRRPPLPPPAAAASASSSQPHETVPHPLSQEQSIDELQSSPIQPQQQEQEETSPRRSRRLSQQGSPQQSPGQQQRGRRRKRTATGERLSSPSWAAVDVDESMDLDLGLE